MSLTNLREGPIKPKRTYFNILKVKNHIEIKRKRFKELNNIKKQIVEKWNIK